MNFALGWIFNEDFKTMKIDILGLAENLTYVQDFKINWLTHFNGISTY